MALSDLTKIDLLFKKSQNKSITDTGKAFYEESIASAWLVDGTDVWTDAIAHNDPATAVAGGVAQAYVDQTLIEDLTASNHKAWKSNLEDWIPSRYGINYTVRVYEDDGAGGLGDEIPSSSSSDWIFDYKSGILFFQDSISAFTTPIHIVGYRYIGGTASTPGAAAYLFTNGLTETLGNVVLGGTLTADTDIELDQNVFSLTESYVYAGTDENQRNFRLLFPSIDEENSGGLFIGHAYPDDGIAIDYYYNRAYVGAGVPQNTDIYILKIGVTDNTATDFTGGLNIGFGRLVSSGASSGVAKVAINAAPDMAGAALQVNGSLEITGDFAAGTLQAEHKLNLTRFDDWPNDDVDVGASGLLGHQGGTLYIKRTSGAFGGGEQNLFYRDYQGNITQLSYGGTPLAGYTFQNGLTEFAGPNVELGGTLDHDTEIDPDGNELWIQPGLKLGLTNAAGSVWGDQTFILFGTGSPFAPDITFGYVENYLGSYGPTFKWSVTRVDQVFASESNGDLDFKLLGLGTYDHSLWIGHLDATPADNRYWRIKKNKEANGNHLDFLYGIATETNVARLNPDGQMDLFTGPLAMTEISTPTNEANIGKIYTRDHLGVTHLVYLASDNTEYALSPTTTAQNGLTLAFLNIVELGGTLIQATTIDPDGNKFWCQDTLTLGDGAAADQTFIRFEGDTTVTEGNRPTIGWSDSYKTNYPAMVFYPGDESSFIFRNTNLTSSYFIIDGPATTNQYLYIGDIGATGTTAADTHIWAIRKGRAAEDNDFRISYLNNGTYHPAIIITEDQEIKFYEGLLSIKRSLVDPTLTSTYGKIYTKIVSGLLQLHYLDDAGTSYQITPANASATAQNGLNLVLPNIVELGGALIKDTTITATGYDLQVVSASAAKNAFYASSSSATGVGIYAENTLAWDQYGNDDVFALVARGTGSVAHFVNQESIDTGVWYGGSLVKIGGRVQRVWDGLLKLYPGSEDQSSELGTNGLIAHSYSRSGAYIPIAAINYSNAMPVIDATHKSDTVSASRLATAISAKATAYCRSAIAGGWGEVSGTTDIFGALRVAYNGRTGVGHPGSRELYLNGSYTGTYTKKYLVVIDNDTSTPNKFKWSNNNGLSWTSGVSITGFAQALSDGITVSFGHTTGYDTRNNWSWYSNIIRASGGVVGIAQNDTMYVYEDFTAGVTGVAMESSLTSAATHGVLAYTGISTPSVFPSYAVKAQTNTTGGVGGAAIFAEVLNDITPGYYVYGIHVKGGTQSVRIEQTTGSQGLGVYKSGGYGSSAAYIHNSTDGPDAHGVSVSCLSSDTDAAALYADASMGARGIYVYGGSAGVSKTGIEFVGYENTGTLAYTILAECPTKQVMHIVNTSTSYAHYPIAAYFEGGQYAVSANTGTQGWARTAITGVKDNASMGGWSAISGYNTKTGVNAGSGIYGSTYSTSLTDAGVKGYSTTTHGIIGQTAETGSYAIGHYAGVYCKSSYVGSNTSYSHALYVEGNSDCHYSSYFENSVTGAMFVDDKIMLDSGGHYGCGGNWGYGSAGGSTLSFHTSSGNIHTLTFEGGILISYSITA